ncbi:MAG: dihydropyrimidinase, partial [Pseudomonadota bacterium]
MKFDTVIKGGTVVTASDTMRADVGVLGGKITALAAELPETGTVIDATGKHVLPGAIETHCHIEQESA